MKRVTLILSEMSFGTLPLVGVICFAILAFVSACAFVYYIIPADLYGTEQHNVPGRGILHYKRDIRHHYLKKVASFCIMIGGIGASAGIGVNHLH